MGKSWNYVFEFLWEPWKFKLMGRKIFTNLCSNVLFIIVLSDYGPTRCVVSILHP